MQRTLKRPLVLSGPSGSGKEESIKVLTSTVYPFHRAVSVTTRAMRVGEVHAKHYFFTNVAEFARRRDNDEFLEFQQVHNSDWYGTPRAEVDRLTSMEAIPIIEVDVKGALTLSKVLDNAVFVFIAPPSLEELRLRLERRGSESQNSIENRLRTAAEEMEIAKYEHKNISFIQRT